MQRILPAFHCPPALAALLCLAVVLAGCGDAEGQQGTDGLQQGQGEMTTPSVEAVQARTGSLPLRERLTGTVRAIGQVGIFPDQGGRVVEVLAENGDRVSEGDPLVRLRAQTARAQLQQARANLEMARAEAEQAHANLQELLAQFKRTQALAEDSLVSAQTLETQQAQVASARASYSQAQAQVKQAQAQVDEREEAMSQTVVRAPISGRVGQRNVEIGMQVGGQTRLYTIGHLDQVRVTVPITQEMIGRIREGEAVEVTAESLPDTVIVGEVSRVSPFLEEGSYSAEAEIDIPNEGNRLQPGMFVTVDVFYGESEQATIVPKSALYDHPNTGQQGIYVATSLGMETQPVEPSADDGKAPLTPATPTQFRPIEVRAEGRQLVGLQGVEPGTWIVVVGQHLLSGRGEDGPVEARVRPVTWERIVSLQQLQRQDLLRQFMEKQQRVARQRMDSTAAADDTTAHLPSRVSM